MRTKKNIFSTKEPMHSTITGLRLGSTVVVDFEKLVGYIINQIENPGL
jgi:hypothetical protein